ncbi:DUF3293 domain-containing protein [Polynucleobacter sp. MWH-CaK5]|uniref:DUF3293 domain-containing protein n=1 Tax=Polynucleobacter sp. MWH-CaK5 TaxID=2689107 RepID=UPI001BFE69EF|nr:DUF3293 domain-containing protein [Polynucleobacter sp. MWH-CaK5]QWD88163.1 DUF3293 domain-containing protein [Polynucleobacter sp. MWH-CaK5]
MNIQEIYRMAHYSVVVPSVSGGDLDVSFKIDEPNQQIEELLTKHERSSACFITASNPNGQRIDEKENEARMKELETLIQEKQLPYYFGQGGDPKGAWIEKSLLVVGIELGEADQLARHFKQNAIVWFQRGSAPTLRWYI